MKRSKELLISILENSSNDLLLKERTSLTKAFESNTIDKEDYTEALELFNKYIKETSPITSISKDGISITNLNYIFMEGNVYSNRNEGILISCNDEENRNYSINTAYFKVYNSASFTKATKIARITILNPKYIYHKNYRNFENWLLSSRERKLLNNIMHSTTDNGISVWELVCKEFNKETGLNFDFGKEIPNFNEVR